MPERPKRYRAFISYSQKDKAYAQRIHQALEHYRLPRGVEVEDIDPKTSKLGRLFRDDDEMGAATDLGAALQGAIADAENLIVVCSPNAAQSRWVNEEVLHFKRTGRADRIFAVIVGGEPNATPDRRERECFPLALRFHLGSDGSLSGRPAEPLGLDERKEPFNRLIVRLAAALVRAPFDTLWKREQRRARARAAAVSFAAVSVLLIVGAAVTQSMWRPRLDAYWRYERFAQHNTRVALMAAAPGTRFQDCREASADCPVMVVIPEGRFLMGAAPDEPESLGNESPRHEVALRRFAVSQYEITFANWDACVAARGCNTFQRDEGWGRGRRPVNNVSWYDAQQYVAWLKDMTGEEYRLLSEAEWEYAARGGTTTDAPRGRFSWGDRDPVCDAYAENGAAYSCGEESTREVGSFRANPFGLHDMHGNVSEWVQDCYAESYEGLDADGSAHETEDCVIGVIRGGSMADNVWTLRVVYRQGYGPLSAQGPYTGFRVARTL